METEHPGSPSPDRGISRLLRKKGGADSPNSSLTPSDSFSEHGGLRASIDRGIDKFKDKRRGSTDVDRGQNEESSTARRLSKLLPKKSRRRKKYEADEDSDLYGGNSSGLGLSVLNSSKLNLQSNNASAESLGQDQSGGSSLLIEDSDPESPAPTRPNLDSRASHKGYLTFSSPLITAETVDSNGFTSNSHAVQADPASGLAANTSPSPIPQSAASLGRFRDVFSSSTNTASPTASEATPLTKANTYPNRSNVDQRPASIASSKPSIRVSTYPEEGQNTPRTPSTVITPPTPVVEPNSSPSRTAARTAFANGSLPTKPISAVPRDSIAHRKTRSASTAGKPPPLTPHIEETKTPGGSVIQPSNSSGFFSSVFSATQNAVSQFSSTFNQPPSQRSRSTTLSSDFKQGDFDEHDGPPSNGVAVPENARSQPAKGEPAIATLGSGNLSLTHLGITDGAQESSPTATRSETMDRAPRSRANTHDAETSIRSEEASVAEAVSAAYSAKAPSERSVPLVTDTSSTIGRPRSIGSGPAVGSGDATPPQTNTGTDPDVSSIRRTGSVRSRLSGTRKRGRNTSAPGGAIAAALAASHGAIANPGNRRPAGLTVANSKRNRDFHALFKSIPEEDHLIEDYSAALQREILLHGRLYLSERHICFSSNILGWVTTLVINFDEIVSMEKKITAMLFPNAIVIQTLHAKNVFASFISRDPTYDQFIRIWRINHPNLKTSDLGHSLDDSVSADKTELASTPETDESAEEESEGDDDDGLDGDEAASSVGRPASIAPSEGAEATRVVSKAVGPSTAPGVAPNANPEKMLSAAAATSNAQDYPGPATHSPTECGDQDTHFDKLVLDTTIPAPLGKVYTMMFGPASGVHMKKFLVDDQKSGDLQLEDDKRGLGEDAKTVSYSYIKPLGGSIGPKQTKCMVTQTLDAFDLEKAVSVTCSTQTPDVPSGNVFVTKTRYCLMWGPGNSTRMLMSCVVEWSGKSWLKGPIETGANNGQTQYGKDIAAFFKTQVATRSPAKVPKGKVKGKKKKAEVDTSDIGSPVPRAAAAAQPAASDWGMFEPLHAILSSVGDLLGPLLSPVGILSALLLVVTVFWMRSPRASSSDGVTFSGLATPQRLAAYDQMWRREENQLWDWLEDRMRLDEISTPLRDDSRNNEHQVASPGDMADNLNHESMSDRQIDEALRVTEEKLQSLKAIVSRKKAKRKDDVDATRSCTGEI